MIFDAPDSTVAACKRERSNTPLQALNLLNDPLFVEAAQALAIRLLREKPASSGRDRIERLFEICLSRRPSRSELEAAAAYFEQQTGIFEKDEAAAAKLMPVELPGITKPVAAAWAALSSVLLNVDEFITRE
jgi:hypothetical protein